MNRIIYSLIIILIFDLSPALAQQISIESPPIMLTGVKAQLSVKGLSDGPYSVAVNNEVIAVIEKVSPLEPVAFSQAHSGTAEITVIQDHSVIARKSVNVIPAWISLMPPLVAILLSFILRSVIPSLFAGLLVGAWAINGLTWQGAVQGLFETMTVYVLNAMTDPDHGAIILFSLLIGGMVGIVSRNGGMVGIVNLVLPIARTPRRGQTVIALLGLGIFFDDYANTMIVGNATRPVSDNLKISREKLAYLVDSTAAPVATIAVITTWIGFQVSLIEEAITHLDGIEQSAYSLFLQSIPFSFYPFLALFFVFLIVLSGKDFGPMYKAELRARDTGAVTRTDSNQSNDRQMDDFQEKPAIPCRAINALVPIGSLVIGVIGGMYISGEGDSLQDIIGSANAYVVLIWASLLACLAAFLITLSQGLLTLNETVEAWVIGARFMLTGLVLLVMAWAVADVTSVLQTASYLISLLGDALSPQLLPTVIFFLAAIAGFASGSSWGVMAILMPLVIPLCWAVLEINGMANSEHLHILYSSIACVLCGAVWADHCSPLSDTTVLSSLATGCDHMDHVTTQLPYAALTGAVALLIGTLPGGYGAPWWLMLLIAALVLFTVHRLLAKSADHP
ncbi:MAG: Na+/H+ antiporter NhaC family protein [Gammaproteobacteria bacterium]|jgi:Na+/H+ antiporter NhaC|nr:Na+/H+ antiporter NhaC family protein [Gammaproteobacteria bacterium]MBT5204533.1 Na+/H+ antiporter NhaC family protein [Gammaproteobacteria bacterium]MBT5602336.1 Na+/H+ antiporter NhaC family protein [Gammaproteobacteria bacterium]MBT6247249.1 Na+/H+ antiporter NhaC family protein [Gammaproteobacteria bacterium]